MSDLRTNDAAIDSAATTLSNFHNSVIFEPFWPSIDSCGSDRVSGAFQQTLALMFGQDRTMRQSWGNVGHQLKQSVQTYNDADRNVAAMGG